MLLAICAGDAEAQILEQLGQHSVQPDYAFTRNARSQPEGVKPGLEARGKAAQRTVE
ncbi:hypothetical protein HB771_00030 (plasmid) [Rhizobium leguminosarum bv. viciae]|nr:hypothetical protein HB771_00030 [Rhizobium leguminosarum bv. viciae]